MTPVLALDLSTKRTGAALPDGRAVSLKPRRATDSTAEKIDHIAGDVERALIAWQPAVVAVEDLLPRQPHTKAAYAAGGIHHVVRVILARRGIACALVSANDIKRWATGKAGADKDEMEAAARAAGGDVANDDEADAWLLRAVTLMAYDDVDLLADTGPDAVRRDVVAKITWPSLKGTA